MKYLLRTLLFISLLALAAPACSDDGDSTPQDVNTPDAGIQDTTPPDGTSPDVGPDEDADADDPADVSDADIAPPQDVRDATPDDAELPDTQDGSGADAEPDAAPPEVFAEISTRGAELSGSIPAQGTLHVTLSASQGDWVVMWLRKDGAQVWDPALSLYKPGRTDALVYSTPLGNDDAHIPYQQDQLADGWEFYQGGEFRLELGNAADDAGPFTFTLECLGGPCLETNPNEDNPFADLNNNALENALRQAYGNHTSLGYDGGRDFMFEYDASDDGQVECVYTGRKVFADNRSEAQNQGFDTEHTWPQSRGARREPAHSDIHHLFPTDSGSNSRRGNLFFDDVISATWSEGGSKIGNNADGVKRFEPRDVHKGNVARALFYFAVMYEDDIPADEEAALRRWHQLDPPDAAEKARNDAIEGVQHNRNPFIDWPELVDQIADF